MPLIDLRRPAIVNTSLPRDQLRWNQQTLDNIDRINQTYIRGDITAQHGVEVLFPNPFKDGRQPVALMSGVAVDTTTGLQQSIASYKFSAPRSDGQIGVTVNYAVPAANVAISSLVPYSSAANLAPATIANVTSIALQPGVWNLTAHAGFIPPATSWTALQSCIAPSSGTLTGNDTITLNRTDVSVSSLATAGAVIPNYELTLSATATYFLVSRWDGVGTAKIYGRLSARCVSPDPATTAKISGILVV